MFAKALLLALVTVLLPGVVLAQSASLHLDAPLFQAREAFLPVTLAAPGTGVARAGASLFAGRAGASLFALPPARDAAAGGGARRRQATIRFTAADAFAAARVRQVIGRAESARDGYDAVQHAARVPPPRRPTALTIGEIYQWIADTPGQQHAIGRYQFIPATLARLVGELGIDEQARFSPAVQDALADRLLEEAGMGAFRAGLIDRHSFMNNLARIWAGLPTSGGKSFYHGFAGNRATMTWAQFDAEMAQIFPG